MMDIIMKNKYLSKLWFLFIVSTFLVASSCSVGYMKDAETGLKLKYNGFSMEDVYLKIDGKKFNSNQIPYGRRVYIEIVGLDQFHVFNGKASIGCEVTITDKDGIEVMHSPDVFTFTDGGYDATLLEEITISMPALYPLKVGETYHWEGRFWDKYSEATMNSEVDVKIVDNKEMYSNDFLKVNFENLDYYTAFVEVDYVLIDGNKAKIDQKLTLNVLDVEGFVRNDSLYEVDYYTSFKDIESGDNFEFYDTLIIDEIKNLYSNYTMGTAVQVGKKYLWTSVFKDLNSGANLEASIEIAVAE